MIADKAVPFVIAATIAVSACHAQAPAGQAGLPLDVTEFIGRRTHCKELADKASRHPADTDQVAVRRLWNCDGVPDDERLSRERYAADANVVAALKDDWTTVVKRVPIRIVEFSRSPPRLPGKTFKLIEAAVVELRAKGLDVADFEITVSDHNPSPETLSIIFRLPRRMGMTQFGGDFDVTFERATGKLIGSHFFKWM